MQTGREARVPLSDRAVEMNLADIPTRNNPIGANGAGEFRCVGAPAAFMNAVAVVAGTRTVDMPATPERPWQVVRAK